MPSESLKPPSDLAPRGRGRRFWRAVVAEHELRSDEHELLAESCRMLDLLDALRDEADGVLLLDGKVHPAVVEQRQVREQLRKTLGVLAIPEVEVDGPDLADVADYRTWRARKAARARWDRGA